VELFETTGIYVSAFSANMQKGRLDAGISNLEHINKILDGAESGESQWWLG
jgi:hypothetical protein